MDPYVITIARQYGSGGRMIGEMLSKNLGIAYYDKNIIRLASDDSGILEELFGGVDEYSTARPPLFVSKLGLYSRETLSPDDKNYISDENMFSFQAKVIRRLAEKESCVIIGRYSNFILDPEEYPNVLRVFLHAPWDFRVEEAMKKMAGTRKEVERFMKKDDKRKVEMCQRFIGKEWTDPAYYDLYLDTGELGFDGAYAEIVKKYNELRHA